MSFRTDGRGRGQRVVWTMTAEEARDLANYIEGATIDPDKEIREAWVKVMAIGLRRYANVIDPLTEDE